MLPESMQSMATPKTHWPRKTAASSDSYMIPVNEAAGRTSSIAMRGSKSTMQCRIDNERHLLHPQ